MPFANYATTPVAFRPSRPLTARGFTLIELLIAIAIIGILAAILIPISGSARLQANMAKSLSNLHQIGTGCLSYVADHGGNLPNAKKGAPATWPQSDWQYQIGPYAQQVSDGPNAMQTWADGLYHCPLKQDWSLDASLPTPDRYRISYSMNAFVTNSGNAPKTVRLNSLEAPSRTWLVGTSGSGYCAVYNTDFLKRRDPAPRYKEGHLVVFCDGSTSYVPLTRLAYDLTLISPSLN